MIRTSKGYDGSTRAPGRALRSGIGSAFPGSAGRHEHMRTALFLVNTSDVGLWESACGVVFACLDDH